MPRSPRTWRDLTDGEAAGLTSSQADDRHGSPGDTTEWWLLFKQDSGGAIVWMNESGFAAVWTTSSDHDLQDAWRELTGIQLLPGKAPRSSWSGEPMKSPHQLVRNASRGGRHDRG